MIDRFVNIVIIFYFHLIIMLYTKYMDRCRRDHKVLYIQLHMQSVRIPTKVVNSNPVHGEVYSIQRYVI